MATQAFKGGFKFSIAKTAGDGGTADAELEEVKDFSGFGKTNPLVDTTSFDSGSKEYIAGLSDGSEIAVTCFRLHPSDASASSPSTLASSTTAQEAVRAHVRNGDTFKCKLEIDNGAVKMVYEFSVVGISEEQTPSFENAHEISFNLKMTGDVTETVSTV